MIFDLRCLDDETSGAIRVVEFYNVCADDEDEVVQSIKVVQGHMDEMHMVVMLAKTKGWNGQLHLHPFFTEHGAASERISLTPGKLRSQPPWTTTRLDQAPQRSMWHLPD